MKDCATLEAFGRLSKEHSDYMDSFHFGKQGRNRYPLINILDALTFKQPRRKAFSCYSQPSHLFPLLGVECQKLYSYGSTGRPAADGRCRPMPIPIYDVGVAAWHQAHAHLSPLSQVCPPFNCQALMYILISEQTTSMVRRKCNSRLQTIEQHCRISFKAPLKCEMTIHKDNGKKDSIPGMDEEN